VKPVCPPQRRALPESPVAAFPARDPSGKGPAERVPFRRRARHGANRPAPPSIPQGAAVSDLGVPASLYKRRALAGRTDFLPCFFLPARRSELWYRRDYLLLGRGRAWGFSSPADPIGREGSTWIARRACRPGSGSTGGWVGRGAWLIGQVWHARRATLVLGGASVARLRASCEETNQPEGAPGAGGLRSLRLGNRRRTARQKDGGE
jgi:hypothetical protein